MKIWKRVIFAVWLLALICAITVTLLAFFGSDAPLDPHWVEHGDMLPSSWQWLGIMGLPLVFWPASMAVILQWIFSDLKPWWKRFIFLLPALPSAVAMVFVFYKVIEMSH